MQARTFYSFCGARLPAEADWLHRCPACGNTTYRNPLPVAVVLVPVEDGGLLLVRRAIEPRTGKLALPDGYVNFGETWQEAEALRPQRVMRLPASRQGRRAGVGRTLKLGGRQTQGPLGLNRFVSANPPGVASFVGSFRAKCPGVARAPPSRLPSPYHPQRLLADLRRSVPASHTSLLRQGRMRDQPCRTLFRTLRSRLNRLVRKTYFFNRIERHLEAIHLFFASYNLRIKEITNNPSLRTP